MGFILNPLDLFYIIACLARDRIAAVTCSARQSDSVLAVFEFIECLGGAVFMHRLDLAMAGGAAFGSRGGR
jgi:hypothetical protein